MARNLGLDPRQLDRVMNKKGGSDIVRESRLRGKIMNPVQQSRQSWERAASEPMSDPSAERIRHFELRLLKFEQMAMGMDEYNEAEYAASIVAAQGCIIQN